MTIAHPGADHCALCMVLQGVLTPATPEWPGFPICRRHIAECIEANEPGIIKPPPSGFAAPSAELQ